MICGIKEEEALVHLHQKKGGRERVIQWNCNHPKNVEINPGGSERRKRERQFSPWGDFEWRRGVNF